MYIIHNKPKPLENIREKDKKRERECVCVRERESISKALNSK